MINKALLLPQKNYIETPTPKHQIVLGNTVCSPIKTYNKWVHRYNGTYKKTASYTISLMGEVYEHFSPEYTSNYLNTEEQNKKSIVILLENDGWLVKNSNNILTNQLGYIYNGDVIESKWRNKQFWAAYTPEQEISTLRLIDTLCNDFYIPKKIFESNTIEDTVNYRGVLYKSNLNIGYTDITPSWNFKKIKKDFEKHEK